MGGFREFGNGKISGPDMSKHELRAPLPSTKLLSPRQARDRRQAQGRRDRPSDALRLLRILKSARDRGQI